MPNRDPFNRSQGHRPPFDDRRPPANPMRNYGREDAGHPLPMRPQTRDVFELPPPPLASNFNPNQPMQQRDPYPLPPPPKNYNSNQNQRNDRASYDRDRASYQRPNERSTKDDYSRNPGKGKSKATNHNQASRTSNAQPMTYERNNDGNNSSNNHPKRRSRDNRDDSDQLPKRPRLEDDRPNNRHKDKRSDNTRDSGIKGLPPKPKLAKSTYERIGLQKSDSDRQVRRSRSRSRESEQRRSRRDDSPASEAEQDDRYFKTRRISRRSSSPKSTKRSKDRHRSSSRSASPPYRRDMDEDDRVFVRKKERAASPQRPSKQARGRSRTRSRSPTESPPRRRKASWNRDDDRRPSQMHVDRSPSPSNYESRDRSPPARQPDRDFQPKSGAKFVRKQDNQPKKKAGFKRVFDKGDPHLHRSVKKFFPDEEEDVNHTTKRVINAPAPAIVEDAAPSAAPVEVERPSALPLAGNEPLPKVLPEQSILPLPAANGTASHPEMPKSAALPTREIYERLTQVGEGTYGKVYKARNTEDDTLVALKRIRMEAEKDGFPITSVREIKLLQSLRHPNVINLAEIMVSHGSVYMVFEYMDHDLTGVLRCPDVEFEPKHLKSLMQQLLKGLAYIHDRGILHRDLKGSNILLDKNGVLKIADFGLARFYAKNKRNDYTNRVITQWYKPPELLYGATVYGAEVDIWSAGCIFLELYSKRPVFQGQDEIHQLDVIFRLMGTPNIAAWPNLYDLPWYELVKPRDVIQSRFQETFGQKYLKTPCTIELAEALLTLNPATRISAHAALDLPYFTEERPEGELPSMLSSIIGDWHELEAKALTSKRKAHARKEESKIKAKPNPPTIRREEETRANSILSPPAH